MQNTNQPAGVVGRWGLSRLSAIGALAAGLLVSIPVAAEDGEKFRPDPLTIFSPSWGNAVLYPLGWSDDGKLALIIREVNEASDYDPWRLRIWGPDFEDLEKKWLKVHGEGQDPETAFERFWKQHGKSCLDAASKHRINLGRIPIFHFPHIDKTHHRMIEAKLDLERIHQGWTYRIRRSTLSVTGVEPIVRDHEFLMSAGIVGYLKSPLPDHFMIVLGIVRQGWEGAPHPRTFDFVGVKSAGDNFESNAEAADKIGRDAVADGDREKAVAAFRAATRRFLSTIASHRHAREPVPADLLASYKQCLTSLEETRLRLAEQRRDEGRYREARELLTDVVASPRPLNAEFAWSLLAELSDREFYEPGELPTVDEELSALRESARLREQFTKTLLSDLPQERIAATKAVEEIEKRARAAGVNIQIKGIPEIYRDHKIALYAPTQNDASGSAKAKDVSLTGAIDFLARHFSQVARYGEGTVILLAHPEPFIRAFSVPATFRENWKGQSEEESEKEIAPGPWPKGSRDKPDPFVAALLSDANGFILGPEEKPQGPFSHPYRDAKDRSGWFGYYLLSPNQEYLLVCHLSERLQKIERHLERLAKSPLSPEEKRP